MTATLFQPLAGKWRVVQLVANLARGDAISDEARTIQHSLRSGGVDSVIVADHCDPGLEHEMVPVTAYEWSPGDLVVLHYSLWSDTAAWFIEHTPRPALMIYHNVTPPQWFVNVNPQTEAETRFAREMLSRFAGLVDAAVGDSPYNQQELAEAGFADPGVLPIVRDYLSLQDGFNQRLANRIQDGSVSWLFVGRVAPNKCQHDVIAAFAAYHRRINPRSRLILVGSSAMASLYASALREHAGTLGVAEAVTLAGHVDRADLLAYYRAADVFVCMSEHEGFCVPLVEAMALGMPVVAYAATAVPGTLGCAGILLKRKDPVVTAEVVNQIVTDGRLRERLIAQGRVRAEEFSRECSEARLADWLGKAAARREMPVP